MSLPAAKAAKNSLAVALAEVPIVSTDVFRRLSADACAQGARLVALPVLDVDHEPQILAVLADDPQASLALLRTKVSPGRAYPALSAALPQAQAFEREIFETHGIRPEGHPWLKPLRAHAELDGRGAPHPFFEVEGEGLHEVAVGPVHAGIIEPGHFRFQCHGESVLSLEIQLGFQHRGAEALFLRSTASRRLAIAESLAGDTSVGHALAYCMAIEALAGAEVPLYAQTLRGIALELERLANHVGDLGMLCNDVGYLPGASWFGRLRGELLNLLMDLSGNRFGRGLMKPGGVRMGVSAAQRQDFQARLARAERDLEATAELTFDSPSVGSRFEETGVVSRETAQALGLVGPAARASGCDRDVRRDHPFGIFRFAHIPVALAAGGDVMGRALVRWVETQRSLTFVREQLAELADGPLAVDVTSCPPGMLVVSMVEGWRGEIVHVALSGSNGDLASYKIVDPSFHNWLGLAMAVRDSQISDFPLCNKSFNLSYAGHDL